MSAFSSTQRTALALAFFCGVVMLLSWRALSVENIPGQPDPDRWGLQDFRDAVYFPCISFRHGGNPYDPESYVNTYPVGQLFSPYSPLTLVIHQPFSLLPQRVAQRIYFAFTIGSTALLAFLILRICAWPVRTDTIFALTGFLLISRPGHMNLVLGQTTVTVVIFCLLSLMWSKQRPLRSGLMLALATFKPTFGAPLFLLLLAQRRFKAAFAGLAIGCLLTLPLIAHLCLIEGGVGNFVESLSGQSSSFDEHQGRNPQTSFSRIDAYLLICKWTGAEQQLSIELAVWLGFLVVAGSLIAWKAPGNHRGIPPLSCGLILLTIVIGIYHHAYDWLLIAPVACLIVAAEPIRLSTFKWERTLLVLVLLIPAANYLATNTFVSLLEAGSAIHVAVTSINSLALLIAWVGFWLILLRTPKNSTEIS